MAFTLKHILPSLLLLAAFVAPAQAQAQRHAHIRLVAERSPVESGQTIEIGIEQTLDPGWHTYWVNPGDSGTSPEISWTLPPGFSIGDIQWPAPKKITLGPVVDYGYQDHAVLLQSLKAPGTLPGGPVKLSAAINILVCKNICVPEQGTYTLELNGTPQDNSAFIHDASAKMPESFSGPVTFGEDHGDIVIRAQNFSSPVDVKKPLMIFPRDWGVFSNAEASAKLKSHELTLRQKAGDRPLKALERLRVVLTYQDKKGTAYAVALEAKPAPVSSQPGVDISLLHALLLALLGGIILNLMPCVFPVLSLKAIKLCKLSGHDLNVARVHSFLYTAGILCSFMALAFVLSALRHAGQQVGWGFQLQNPVFVLPLSWLLFVIGLNLSGFFEFNFRFMSVGGKLTAGDGLTASFFTGVLAAVVATPCTAPFMGVAMGYALTQPPFVTLLVMLGLGLGLALPFLLLSFVPALRALLPKPGHWMVTFRQLLAFPLYASAAWLAWVFSVQAGPTSIIIVLSGAVAIAFALWLLEKAPPASSGIPTLLVRALAAVVFIYVAALIPLAGRMQNQAAQTSIGEDWTPFTASGFVALEKGNAPLFVDMSAAWCITCKVNESAVLDTAAVGALFHAHKVHTVLGDWTNRNPDITAFLARFNRDGVPIYVYFGPRNAATGQRPEPVVLPQLLTLGIVERTLDAK